MPVKKTKKPNHKKTSRQNIKKAVEKLPGLIVEQVRLSEPEQQMAAPTVETVSETTGQPEQKKPSSTSRARAYHNPRQTRWLWTGVILFCLVIFGLWGWNMYVMIGDATQTNGPTTWMPNPVTDDLRAVWEEVGAADDEQDEKETTKEKIKTDLKALLSQIKSLPAAIIASTTPTTTEPATVSL